MSSTPIQEYAILDEVKFKLNIDTSDLSQDVQITVATNDSNNYIAEQTAVHATVVVAGNDPSLSSMANNLAAAYFNFWLSTEKDREELERWQNRIQQYIMAKYGKKSANMLSGEETIGVTGGFVSASSSTLTTTISSPLTTKGDIWGYNATDARIPVGADTLILTADSSNALGVSWQVPGGGLGDVVGPTGATDEAIARYDTTTGKLIQNSGVLIDDSDNVTGVTSIAIGDGTWIISEDVSDELLFTSPTGDGSHGIKVVSETGEIILQNIVSNTFNDYTALLSTNPNATSDTTDIAFSIQNDITTASDSGADPITQIQGTANSGTVSTRPIFGFYNFTTKIWEIDKDGNVDMQNNNLLNAALTTPTITDFTNAVHDHENATGGGQLTATDALDATGTKDSTTFLRGDDTWEVPPGGGGSQTPWLSDIDADGFDLIDLKNIEFRNITGTPPASTTQAIFTTTSIMRFNVPTGDTFDWGVNGSTDLTLSESELNLQSNTLGMGDDTSIIWDSNANRRINNSTTGFIFDVETSDNFDYQINSASEYTFDATELNLNFNNLVDIGSGTISDLSTIDAPVTGDFLLILDDTDSVIKKVDASEFTGLVSINSDTTPAQTIAAGTGLGIVDAGATHTLSIDSTVVTLTDTQSLTNKSIVYSGQAQWNKGATVASPAGGILTLGTDGNVFTISGTNTIDEIDDVNWQAGSVIILEFSGILTVTNDSGGTNDILLGDGADYLTAAGESLELWFDGADWREISRSVGILSFPINFPENSGGDATATQDISFAGSNRHSQQFTLTQDTTLTFSGTITDTTEYIDLFILQDGTGGWTLTLPLGTINKDEVEAGINLGADDETYILLKFAFGIFYAFIQGGLPVPDTTPIVEGSDDATKLLRFEVDGFTTATTRVITPPDADGTIDLLEVDQTITGAKTFGESGDVSKLLIAGTTSGVVTLDATAAASGILTLPNGADTLVGRATSDTLTNKSIDGDNNTISNLVIGDEVTGASTALTDTANLARITTANTYTAGTKQSFVADSTTAGININNQVPSATTGGDIWRDDDVLTYRNNADDADIVIATTSGTLAQFAATTSSQLAGVISDETGSGSLVFASSPTLVTPLLGTPTSGVATNLTGLPLTTGVTGTLAVGNGGTGDTTLDSTAVLTGNGTGTIGSSTDLTFASSLLTGFESSDTLTDSFEIRLQKQQTTDPEQVILNDSLGKVTFYGADTDVPAFAEGGRLEFLATETWGDTDHGTRLEISTTTDGDDTPTVQLTIEEDGTANFQGNTITNAVLESNLDDGSMYIGDQNDASKQIPTGLETKEDCRLATTSSNVDLTTGGLISIDSVTTVAADRVLVKNQDDPSENGIYAADASTWNRTTDADADAEVNNGMFTLITAGTVNANTAWVLTTSDPITLDTTDLTFNEFNLNPFSISGLIDGTYTQLDSAEIVFEQDNEFFRGPIRPNPFNELNVRTQAQLEAKFGANLEIPDNESWTIFIDESFSLAKPFLVGANTSLEISAVSADKSLTWTGTGALIKNKSTATEADFVRTIRTKNISIFGTQTNSFIDVLSNRTLFFEVTNFISFSELGEGESNVIVFVRCTFNNFANGGFRAIGCSIFNIEAGFSNNQQLSNLTIFSLLTRVTTRNPLGNMHVTITNFREFNSQAGNTMFFLEPSPITGTTYVIKDCTTSLGTFYQNDTQLKIISVADAGGGDITYTVASPATQTLASGDTISLNSFTDSNYNGTKTVTASTSTTFDVTETFTATDVGFLLTLPIEITSVADAGGGDIEFTTAISHGLTVNDEVRLREFENTVYNGLFTVNSIGTRTFDVTATFTATGTGVMDATITSVTDAGSGDIQFTTTTAHGLKEGKVIVTEDFSDSNYNGSFIVKAVSGLTFDVTATFTATGTGTMNANSADSTNLSVTARDNPGTPDSMISGEITLFESGGETVTISASNTPVAIGGAWDATSLERTSVDSVMAGDGKLQYIGIETTDLTVDYSATLKMNTGTGKVIGINLLKTSDATTTVVESNAVRLTSSGNSNYIFLQSTTTVNLQTDDQLEVAVVNYTDTVDIDVQYSKLLLSQGS